MLTAAEARELINQDAVRVKEQHLEAVLKIELEYIEEKIKLQCEAGESSVYVDEIHDKNKQLLIAKGYEISHAVFFSGSSIIKW